MYGFIGNNGVNRLDNLGLAVFILTALPEGDPQLTGSQVKITEEDIAKIDKFLADLDAVSDVLFKEAVAKKKVKFNGVVYSGNKADFRAKVEREKSSKTENISEGGLETVGKKLKEYANPATEPYDQVGLVAHGGWYDDGKGGWESATDRAGK